MKKLAISLAMLVGFFTLMRGAEPIKVSRAAGDSLDPRLEISTVSNEIFIVWQDKRPAASGLYFRRFNSAGTPQTAEVRFSNSGSKSVLAVGTDNQARIAWLSGSTVCFGILNPDGQLLVGPVTLENNCWQPSISLGLDNETNIVYEHRDIFSYYVVFSRFDAQGKGPVCRVKLDNGDIIGDWRKQPDVWSDAFGSSLVFFTDRRGWDRTMCLGLINPAQAGKPCPLDPTQWIFCGADQVVSPTVTFWPPDARQIFYFWQERVSGRDRILTVGCQPIDGSSRNARAPKAVCAATQVASLVWQDDRDGNWEIYLGQVSAEGKLIASQRLTNTAADSLNPDITLINEKPIIVWQEKEASGFEVYLGGEFVTPPPARLPVIIIPGIMGTELRDAETNELIWLDPDLALQPDDPWLFKLSFQEDGETSNLVMGGRPLIPGNIINIEPVYTCYKSLALFLVNTGSYILHENLFFFGYDWRLDIGLNRIGDPRFPLVALRNKIEAITQGADNKVDIIAHSLGGILIRAYIKQYPVDHRINSVIFLGTPHLGSPQIYSILEGHRALIRWLNKGEWDLSDIIEPDTQTLVSQNFPAAYELLPQYNFIERNGKFETYQESYTDLSSRRNATLITRAYQFQSQIAGNYPAEIKFYAINGSGQRTVSAFRVLADNCFVPYFDLDGDGTVPYLSATAFSNTNYFFANEKHGDLPGNEKIQQKIWGILQGNPEMTVSGIETQPFRGSRGRLFSGCCPIRITISDSEGQILGHDETEILREKIPGSAFFTFANNEAGFLPYESRYDFQIKAIDSGRFSLTLETVDAVKDGPEVIEYRGVPIIRDGIGKLTLSPDNPAPILYLDLENDGKIDFELQPNIEIPEEINKQFVDNGDVNHDYRLDIADAISILSYLFAQSSLRCIEAVDANQDGRVDIADPITLLTYLFANGQKPKGLFFCP